MAVAADDLDTAVAAVTDTLGPATNQDWSTGAGCLERGRWHTAEHIGDVLRSYAAQLVARWPTMSARSTRPSRRGQQARICGYRT
jgi:hypothetical protein